LILPWAVLFGTNYIYNDNFIRLKPARAAYDKNQCNWHCHNVACNHASKLGKPFIGTAGQKGYYEQTIAYLKKKGKRYSDNQFKGYVVVNMLFLCLGWPLLMYALFLVVIKQRVKLKELE